MSLTRKAKRTAQRKAIEQDMGSLRQAKRFLRQAGYENLSLEGITQIMEEGAFEEKEIPEVHQEPDYSHLSTASLQEESDEKSNKNQSKNDDCESTT